MKKLLAGTALGLSLIGHAACAQQFSNLVIFGDSLSDTGNIAKLVPPALLSTLPPGSGAPVPPYYNFRFSNGPIYADVLGSRLGITGPTSDFALGGAYSGRLNEVLGAVPISGANVVSLLNALPIDTSVDGQIASYLASGAPVSRSGLYVVWGGANDYLAMATALAAQPALSTTQIQAIVGQQVQTTVGNLVNGAAALAKAGAHDFVVPVLPNLGATPSLNTSAAGSQLGQLTTFTHNSALATAMGAFGQQAHVNVYLVDTAGLFNDILSNPGKYGVSNTTQACLGATGVCANPNANLFWDGVHPTSGISQLFAQAVTATVEAPLVIGAQGQMADIATETIFDGVSSRINALWQGASGFTLSGPGGASQQAGGGNPLSFYISGSFGEGERDTRINETGLTYMHGSAQAGADYRAPDSDLAIGAQVGFGTTSAKLKDGMGDDDMRSYSVALYAALLGQNWWGSAAGFYAYQDYDKLSRNTYVVGQVAEGATNGTSLGAKAEGGYMLHEGGVAFGPTAEIRYSRITINSYTESGAVALNQSVDDQSYGTLIGALGMQASVSGTGADGTVWSPTLRAAWDHQFNPGSRDVYSRLASLPQATIDTALPHPGQNWARLGLGLNVRTSNWLTIIGDIDGTAGRAYGQDVSGMLRVLAAF